MNIILLMIIYISELPNNFERYNFFPINQKNCSLQFSCYCVDVLSFILPYHISCHCLISSCTPLSHPVMFLHFIFSLFCMFFFLHVCVLISMHSFGLKKGFKLWYTVFVPKSFNQDGHFQ